MRAVLLGAPGAGKGTQAKILTSEILGMPHISTGDILRQAVADETALGKEVKAYMDAGKLAPDHLLVALVKERISRPDCASGFLLDGFPRTLAQAEALEAMLSELGKRLDVVANVDVASDALIERLTGRRSCPDCGAVYHTENNTPDVADVCDRCGSGLIQRSDDTRTTVERRLEAYEKQTKPLVQYYRDKKLLVDIDGALPVEEVAKQMRELFKSAA